MIGGDKKTQATVAALILWAATHGPLCPVAGAGITEAVVADSLAAGGGSLTNSFCRIVDSALGEAAGVVTNATATDVVKTGYAGQLYDVVSLSVDAAPPTVNEDASRQLTVVATYDDDTRGIPDVSWRVTDGPIASVDPDGTVHAGAVCQDTPATVEARHASVTGAVALTVLDTLKDNYGMYAMDGIADSWQASYFGSNNTNAAPSADPDNDGQNNGMEFIAGTIPTNGSSSFRMTIQMDSHTNKPQLVLDPAYANRSYTLLVSTNLLSGLWQAQTYVTGQTNGSRLFITDLGASNSVGFYKASIKYEWQ